MFNKFSYIIFITIFSLVLLIGIFIYEKSKYEDGKLHVIFCNVGQGDGILIRTPSAKDIVLDGGPNDSILQCLNRHLPFWDRDIALMMLSHPHADHLNGLLSVLQRFSVKVFVTENLANKTQGYKELLKELKDKGVKEQIVYAQDSIRTKDPITVKFLGPSKAFIKQTSPNGIIGENKEFGSLITLLSYGSFSVLFTGDSQVEELSGGVGNILTKSINVLQVPHHGSRFGLSESILDNLHPGLAVISVGKNNYGHPSPYTLDLLAKKRVHIVRTDQRGDVEIVSDGKTWSW